MGVYLFCLSVGFAGLLVMALLGHTHLFGHQGNSHAGEHTHAGHAHAHGAHTRGHHHSHEVNSGRWAVLAWLSPRVLFGLLFAFGASGYLLQHLLPAAFVVLIALALAFAFERWIVQPLWRLLSGFASNPAQTLDSALLEEAEAVTTFDHRGNGLVSLSLDGQIVQILGTLNDIDRQHGVRIRAGDRLSITAVDPRRNRCTVTRLPILSSRQTA